MDQQLCGAKGHLVAVLRPVQVHLVLQNAAEETVPPVQLQDDQQQSGDRLHHISVQQQQ